MVVHGEVPKHPVIQEPNLLVIYIVGVIAVDIVNNGSSRKHDNYGGSVQSSSTDFTHFCQKRRRFRFVIKRKSDLHDERLPLSHQTGSRAKRFRGPLLFRAGASRTATTSPARAFVGKTGPAVNCLSPCGYPRPDWPCPHSRYPLLWPWLIDANGRRRMRDSSATANHPT
jgi:hypothetical protein